MSQVTHRGAAQMSPPAHGLGGASAPGATSLLDSLGAAELGLLQPMQHVRLRARYTLFEAGEELKQVYFPTSGVFSLAQPDERGAMLEIAHLGAGGVLGLGALLEAPRARQRAVVQVGGGAYRVAVSSARRAFSQSAAFRALILRFAELLLLQLSNNLLCKMRHTLEQQFCRRLLFYAERVPGGVLEMTHEQFAEALGSRRQGITEAARKLQARNVITYSRGCVSVVDRAALERHACDCYGVLREANGKASL